MHKYLAAFLGLFFCLPSFAAAQGLKIPDSCFAELRIAYNHPGWVMVGEIKMLIPSLETAETVGSVKVGDSLLLLILIKDSKRFAILGLYGTEKEDGAGGRLWQYWHLKPECELRGQISSEVKARYYGGWEEFSFSGLRANPGLLKIERPLEPNEQQCGDFFLVREQGGRRLLYRETPLQKGNYVNMEIFSPIERFVVEIDESKLVPMLARTEIDGELATVIQLNKEQYDKAGCLHQLKKL